MQQNQMTRAKPIKVTPQKIIFTASKNASHMEIFPKLILIYQDNDLCIKKLYTAMHQKYDRTVLMQSHNLVGYGSNSYDEASCCNYSSITDAAILFKISSATCC